VTRVRSKFLTITVPVFLAAAVIVAGGVEVWVRARWNPRNGQPGLFLSDAVRGQRFAANYDGWFAGVPVHINNLGFRDPRDYSIAKSPGTYRIVFLGDSVTFGHGSVYEHTYPYLLEQKLKQWRPAVNWQVWNLAVPGYNTSQELAHLEEIGPQFSPDLVVVGFYENDLVDNRPPGRPGVVRTAAAKALSFAQRHVYSIELYKKVFLQLAWRLSASDSYKKRLENVNSEEKELRHTGTLADAKQQQLTNFDYVGDDELRGACPSKRPPTSDVADAAKRQDGYEWWVNAVRGFQQLNRDGKYRIVFFLNVAPMPCPDSDETFYDDGPYGLNALFLRVLGTAMPVVSTHDALLHTRPSQMPGWSGHSFGNTNVVKADVLFSYLRDRVLPAALKPRTQTSAAGR
jgi:GDSL-like Lipase/Acylhydrolase family